MSTKEIFYEWDIATQINNEDVACFNFNLESILNVQENILDDIKNEGLLDDWMELTGLNLESLTGAIESLVFMSDKPVSINELKKSLSPFIPLKVIHECLNRLSAEYEESHHGIRLMEIASGYQFRTKPRFVKFIQNHFNMSAVTLTPNSLEVLALIAYRQPISKPTIDEMRGVDSGHLIRALMDRRLVQVIGRSETELGKPSIYATTEDFLDVFSLRSLEDLPTESELFELATQKKVADISEIKNIVYNSEKNKFNFDEFEELELLSESIDQIAVETQFTQSMKDQEKQIEDKKTAFELLEEFVTIEETKETNLLASQSHLLSSIEAGRVFNLEGLKKKNEFTHEKEFMDTEIEQVDMAQKNIEEKQSEVVDKAMDLDLDLSFLNGDLFS